MDVINLIYTHLQPVLTLVEKFGALFEIPYPGMGESNLIDWILLFQGNSFSRKIQAGI